jgi:hypothetical protein
MVGKSKSAVIGRHKRLQKTKYNFAPEDLRKYGSWVKPKYFKPENNYLNRPQEIYTSYGEPVILKDLTGCLFPIEGTNLFCNAKKEGVYCKHHNRICYTGSMNAEKFYEKNKNIK